VQGAAGNVARSRNGWDELARREDETNSTIL